MYLWFSYLPVHVKRAHWRRVLTHLESLSYLQWESFSGTLKSPEPPASPVRPGAPHPVTPASEKHCKKKKTRRINRRKVRCTLSRCPDDAEIITLFNSPCGLI